VIACRTLGDWELTVDGQAAPSDLTWKKNFALLVYLARSPKRSRTRDHLIGLLWAEKPEHDARRSLNVALSTLRQRLGKGSLDTGADHVRLNPGFVELDVDRFEYLAQLGDLKGAAELVGGDFLSGFSLADASEFENWLQTERTRVRHRSVDVLTQRAEELLDRGRVTEAGQLADQALDLDQLFEPALRVTLRTRALSGDRAGALSRYETFKALLVQRVGATPDRETAALADRVRSERAWGFAARTEHGEERKSEPARRAPLEDRIEALERLLAVWRGCRGEQRRCIAIIEGDPGMGKTRLAEELVARARVDGAVIAGVRAVEADLAAPWSGVRGLCRGGLLGAPGVTGASPAALVALRDETGASPQLGRALAEAVVAVCHEQPLVLVLEDAQWLDRESLLAVLATLRDPPGVPLAIVVTTALQPLRAELDETRAHLGREIAGDVVRLGPLSREAIERLTRWTLPVDDEEQLGRVARRVAADSAGIPLLAVALLEAVAAGLDLGDGRAGWPVPGRTLEQTLPADLPESVVGAIRVMFGRTGADGQRLLVAAAVLNDRTPGPTLGRAADVANHRLAAELDELERKQWLTAEPRGYAFVARIFRDVIDRDMVTEGQRIRILEALRTE